MDDRVKLDRALTDVQGAHDVTASGQMPWHAPVIDIVPLKNAQTNAGTGADGSGNTNTEIC
jgi:hypothetical protein